MILDHIHRIDRYARLFEGVDSLSRLIEPLRECPPGRYELDCGYALLQEGQTAPWNNSLFEAHRQYIDLQIVLGGQECVEWNSIHRLTVQTPYDQVKDIELLDGTGVGMSVTEGLFYILFPSDAHKACIHRTVPTGYRKLVIKIPYSNPQ